MYETLNSYSMIVKPKTINYDGPRFHLLSDPFTQARSEQAVELTRANKRAVKALDRKPSTARPRTQHNQRWGWGFFVSTH